MKVILAEHFGICFGVRDAIARADALARQAPLTILGELVHNPIVRARLRALGVREDPSGSAGENSRVLITAHGSSDAHRARLRERGLEIADGTCPLVRLAHEQLKRLVQDGYFPVVIGLADHVEVRGLIGDFPDAVVVGESSDIARLPSRSRYGIISQTTQPIDRVRALVAEIARVNPDAEVRFADTVCKPTKDRQSALKKLISVAEAVVVVGGKTSNNTRQLVETCRAAGRIAFHIERPEELQAKWFDKIDAVGLTAGTSTLSETVEAVHRRLQEISATKTEQTQT